MFTLITEPQGTEGHPQETGAFFQQQQRDGVSCGLASLNAFHGHEVVTKQSAYTLLNRADKNYLAWEGNTQLS